MNRKEVALPENFLQAAFGAVLFLSLICLHLPLVHYGEKRDWLLYFCLITGFPSLLAFLLFYPRAGLWRFFRRCSFFMMGIVVALNSLFYFNLKVTQLGLVRGLAVGLIWAAFDFAVIWFLAKRLSRGRDQGFFLTIWLLGNLLARLSIDDRLLAWAAWNRDISFLIFPLMLFLCWKASSADRAAAEKNFSKADCGWLLFFGAAAAAPLKLGDSAVLHHLSFYLGPIQWIRNGGILLHDAPSQYGFLSILVPALLPLPPNLAFRFTFGVLLLLQAALTYFTLCTFPISKFRRTWAGVMSTMLVFLIPGFTLEIGAFGAPSTAAYRFFWPVALALVLIRRGPLRTKDYVLSTLLFVGGALWSFETLAYCVTTLGACAAMETGLAWKQGRLRQLLPELLLRFVTPVAAVLLSVMLIQVFYLAKFGFSPDWWAFIEFPISYASGFGAIPIQSLGATNALLAVFSFVTAYLIWLVKENPELETGSLFSIWGTLAGTLTYFISRSHPNNIVNLMCFWFPLFVYLGGHAYRKTLEGWVDLFRPAALLLSVALLVIGFGEGGSIKVIINNLLGRHSFSPSLIERPEIDKSLPLISFTDWLRPFDSAQTYGPWLPIHSHEMFMILSVPRQQEYLRRALRRVTWPKVQLVRASDDEIANTWLKELQPTYKKVGEVSLGNTLFLDTYVRNRNE